MGAAFMVSYTRAKSEGLGFSEGTGMAAVGVMPREIRLVILQRRPRRRPARPPTSTSSSRVALAVIAIGATITVIQRIVHVRGQAKSQPTTTHPVGRIGEVT